MVHKSSHRGVHSGNTLRAFNCRYSRRYHHQACIISRVRPELLKKLVGDGHADNADQFLADDKRVEEPNNVAVDVALSLNKQSRWLLPSALIRQIRSNDVQSDLTVSLMERHKLKRPANCVSFHSNKGEVKRIQPRNGRYFSFNFPTVDGKSRRALRREQKEEILEQLKMHNKKENRVVTAGKTVEVFTKLGRVEKSDLTMGESEVRYEVFYPSPAQSSISHNPKYIKQDISVAPDNDGEFVQNGKPKKQHRGRQRKRMSLKDLDECDLPSFYEHFDHDLALDYPLQPKSCHQQSLPPVCDETEVGEEKMNDSFAQQQTTHCLLSSLIEKTERLQKMVGVAKTRRSKKSGSDRFGGLQEEDTKSHIIYLSPEPNNDNTDDNTSEADSFTQVELTAYSPQGFPGPSDATRVLLPKEDVTMASLRDAFGKNYFEASCKPRKFVLNITSNIRELMKKRGVAGSVAQHTDDAATYLVLIHDGFYDDEYDVYKVLLNSKLREGLLPVQIRNEEIQDLYRGTILSLISKAVDFTEEFVAELQEQGHFPRYLIDAVTTKVVPLELQHHLGSAEAYMPSLQRIFEQGSTQTHFTLPSLTDMLQEEPAFCDVCYDDISPLTQDSAAATALLKCQHRVCDACWSQHVQTRLNQGFVRVTCPGYDCQEEVKVGVLLSVAPLNTVEKVLQRQEETRIGSSAVEKWCPNEACGRVLHLQSESPSSLASTAQDQLQRDVLCACGLHVCFSCLSPAHWPASCAQAEEYRTKLSTTVFPDRNAEVHDDSQTMIDEKKQKELEAKKVMMVEGKHCPKCRNFVYKFGGCPQMTCRCGQLFCWFCGKAGYSHPNRGPGCVNENEEKKLTTTIVVRHLEYGLNDKKEEKPKMVPSQRQKVSLLERAVEHRQRRLSGQHSRVITSMAKAITSVAHKDKTLAQHIINICSNTSFSPDSCPTHSPRHSNSTTPVHAETAPQYSSRVHEVVTSFLKRAERSKQELYEVTEYSLVLIKDLPDSLQRRRALRISEDLGAFCTFMQSIFEAWATGPSNQGHGQEGVKAITRLAEIQRWINSALASHVTTVRKLRSTMLNKQ